MKSMTAKTKATSRSTAAPAASTKEATELLVLLSGVLVGLKKPPRSSPKHDELSEAFEKSELGERHIAPLIALVISGPASVSELADRIGLTPATTSLLVGELSRAGFVERREDESDRRRTIVSIDSSIEDVVRPSLQDTLAPLARGLGRMSAAQRTQLMDGLRILGEEMGRSKKNGG
jgi:DNA-binding MarR family transcriptional regulator